MSKPEFHLRRVEKDGRLGPLEIFSLSDLPADMHLSRRGFVGAGIGIGTLLAGLTGCREESPSVVLTPGKPKTVVPPRPQPPKPEPTFQGRRATRIHAHTGYVAALAVSKDGTLLASSGGGTGGDSEKVKIWSLPGGKLKHTLVVGGSGTKRLAFTPDGSRLLVLTDFSRIRLFDLSGTVSLDVTHKRLVDPPQVTADGRMLVTTVERKEIRTWLLPEGTEREPLINKHSHIQDWLLMPDGRGMIVGLTDGTVRQLSLPDGGLVKSLRAESTGEIRQIAVSADGAILVAKCSEGRGQTGMKYWELPQGRDGCNLPVTGAIDSELALSPDGRFVAAWMHESDIYNSHFNLWSVSQGAQAVRLKIPAMAGSATKPGLFTPDSKMLVVSAKAGSGSSNQVLHVMSVPDGASLGILDVPDAREFVVTADGRLLIAGDSAGVITIWDLPGRKLLGYAFDPAASPTDGNTYDVVDAATGRTVTYTLPCGSPIPPGAVCTCNCVPGTYRLPVRSGSGGSYRVCTCIPVYIPSDRASKTDIVPVDAVEVLERLMKLPIQEWRYREEDTGGRHIGPMAQDFAAAFGVGDDDRVIHSVDAHGVAMAAIQGLHQRLIEGTKQELALRAEIARLHRQNQDLERRLQSLEAKLADSGPEASS